MVLWLQAPQLLFFYKCDNFYNKESEGGIIYNDKTININWQVNENDVILSDKDKVLPSFAEAVKFL